MPADTPRQARFMGMVHAYQKGELDMGKVRSRRARQRIRRAAQSMTQQQTADFTRVG